MQIVIELSEEDYNNIDDCILGVYGDAIKNGTPLPKGHGRVGDIDELHNTFKNACDDYNIDNLSFISYVNMNFDLAQTIIPADKDGELNADSN